MVPKFPDLQSQSSSENGIPENLPASSPGGKAFNLALENSILYLGTVKN